MSFKNRENRRGLRVLLSIESKPALKSTKNAYDFPLSIYAYYICKAENVVYCRISFSKTGLEFSMNIVVFYPVFSRSSSNAEKTLANAF